MNNQEAQRYGVKNMNATDVTITSKNLKSIPAFIFDMPNLRSLNLSNNQIESVPEKIGTLKNLKRLSLDSNKITSLPSSIGSMTNLHSLRIYGNELTTLPALVFNATRLTLLDLGNNKLTSVPESIGNLKALEYLYLDDNTLTRLPESIGNLRSLKTLGLVNNKLTRLPETIGNLTTLAYLHLNDNTLSSLPESIGNLRSLKTLGLANNKLTRLPESIGNLANLDGLVLNGNPLMSVSKLPKKATIEYDGKFYKAPAFLEMFKTKVVRKNGVRINNKTNVFNGAFSEARLSNVPPNKRAFINTTANVKNNGTLRRIYNVNGLTGYMKDRRSGRLHGGNFTSNKITLLKNVPFKVNKSAYLRNMRNGLTNTSVNNMVGTIAALKNQLPTNVSKNDVNRLAKNVARNRVKNAPASTRNRVVNALRAKGLLTNEDVKNLKK